MFSLNETMRYHLCPGRTDMRKGINSLIGVVREKMGADVRNGDVFIFIGSSRRLIKLLHAEGGEIEGMDCSSYISWRSRNGLCERRHHQSPVASAGSMVEMEVERIKVRQQASPGPSPKALHR